MCAFRFPWQGCGGWFDPFLCCPHRTGRAARGNHKWCTAWTSTETFGVYLDSVADDADGRDEEVGGLGRVNLQPLLRVEGGFGEEGVIADAAVIIVGLVWWYIFIEHETTIQTGSVQWPIKTNTVLWYRNTELYQLGMRGCEYPCSGQD